MLFLVRLLVVFFVITNCYAKQPMVGDRVGDDGIVFCVTDDPRPEGIISCRTAEGASGRCAYVMFRKDSSPDEGVSWSKKHSNTSAQSRVDGRYNTEIIMKERPKDKATNNAAFNVDKECSNFEGVNLDNWYLPSITELLKMFEFAERINFIGDKCSKIAGMPNMQCLKGGVNYWSSTELEFDPYTATSNEKSASHAWLLSNGQFIAEDKTNKHRVRAIRFFDFLKFKKHSLRELMDNHPFNPIILGDKGSL